MTQYEHTITAKVSVTVTSALPECPNDIQDTMEKVIKSVVLATTNKKADFEINYTTERFDNR